MESFVTSLRLAAVTLLVCVGGYTALILGFAQVVTPHTANGSLLTSADGRVIGSELIAQSFTRPQYFWPRPSAVGFDGARGGGSNKSPTSTDLTERARATVVAHGASAERPLPADLAAASGGGLDPHITERAAMYQVDRIASARGVQPERVRALVTERAFAAGGLLAPDRIVNVLELNLALDAVR